MRETKYEAFGALLRRTRLERQLTQTSLAARSGLAANHVSAIEVGVRLISLVLFARLSIVLECDPVAFLRALYQPLPAVRTVRMSSRGRIRAPKTTLSGKYADFGRMLGDARRARNQRQEDLADRVGCSNAYLIRIETGRAVPSLPLFAQLHQALEFDARSVLLTLCEEYRDQPFRGFGEILESARLARSLSTREVANAVGHAVQYYEHIERGVLLPTMRDAILIHQVVQFDANLAMKSVWSSGPPGRSEAENTV